LIAVAAAVASIGLAACADPDDSGDTSDTTVVTVTQADVQTIPPTSSTLPPGPGEVVNQALDYEVQSGDYLAGIAAKYSVSLDELIAYNEFPEGANHPLYPGDVIQIPPGYTIPAETTTTTTAATAATTGSTDSTAAGEETSTTVDTSQGGSYEVQAGDYLAGIATKVGSTVDAIVAANGWADGASHPLYPGDIIKIP
jgi:LysM repeat protein